MELPLDAARLLIERYARLLEQRGDEIGKRPLVLPTAEFFPDEFRGDAASLRRLVKRMRRHAGLADVPIRANVLEAEEEASGGGCSSGACAVPKAGAGTPQARVVESGEEWLIQVPAAELRHPVVLTTNVARSLALVFLLETRAPDENIAEPLDVSIDITAVALGFGELLLEGSHIYQKSCGGPSIGKVTGLTYPEVALLLALFVHMGDHSARKVKKQLPVTQAEAFSQMWEIVHAQRGLCEALASAPERVAEGFFSFKGEVGGRDDAPSLAELEASLRAAPPKRTQKKSRDPADDELSALVGEALAVTRADAE
jgi:hypothetical protein